VEESLIKKFAAQSNIEDVQAAALHSGCEIAKQPHVSNCTTMRTAITNKCPVISSLGGEPLVGASHPSGLELQVGY
jgi:hypothetical protein